MASRECTKEQKRVAWTSEARHPAQSRRTGNNLTRRREEELVIASEAKQKKNVRNEKTPDASLRSQWRISDA